jgi:hypothetical protein
MRTLPAFPLEQTTAPIGRPPRIARLVALAHRLEEVLQSRALADYRDLAQQAQVAPTRISQIVILAYLAPDIQEYVLFLSAEYSGLITELQLRNIARELLWDRQRAMFAELLSRRR